MVRKRGYQGSPSHFRNMIALVRPKPAAEAYLRLKTLPGEQAQIDWAHFGKVKIGRAERPLMGFVMVLSFSRRIFLRFYLNAQMSNFLRGHIDAFEAWQGVPRELWYDNLKSVVLERRGDAIRFNPQFLDFAGHYRFLAQPSRSPAERRGASSGLYAMHATASSPARSWRDIDDLNAQAQAWCDGIAADRPWLEDRSISVREAFEKERGSLIALPGDRFPADERLEVTIGKTPYARFDKNDYSVPHTHVSRTLVVLATLDEVRILDGADVIATHPRSFDKAERVENPEHIDELARQKRHARRLRGQDRLVQAAPNSERLLADAAKRGGHLGSIVAALLRLLDEYGAAELETAIGEALKRGVPHPNAVRLSLARPARGPRSAPSIPVDLPKDPRLRDSRSATTISADTTDWPKTPRRTAKNDRHPQGACPRAAPVRPRRHWDDIGETAGCPPSSLGKRKNGEAAASSAASPTPESHASNRSPTSTGTGPAAATGWPSMTS